MSALFVVVAMKAISRVRWHLNESRRFFGELALPEEMIHASRLDAWLIDHCRREQTHRAPTQMVQRYITPRELRDAEKISAAAKQLGQLNRARVEQEGKRKFIAVNPALLDPEVPGT